MSQTATQFTCLHCDAPVTSREITEGWCDSCGKKLPLSMQADMKRSSTASTIPTKPAIEQHSALGNSKRFFMGVAAAATAVLVAAIVFLRVA